MIGAYMDTLKVNSYVYRYSSITHIVESLEWHEYNMDIDL